MRENEKTIKLKMQHLGSMINIKTAMKAIIIDDH